MRVLVLVLELELELELIVGCDDCMWFPVPGAAPFLSPSTATIGPWWGGCAMSYGVFGGCTRSMNAMLCFALLCYQGD